MCWSRKAETSDTFDGAVIAVAMAMGRWFIAAILAAKSSYRRPLATTFPPTCPSEASKNDFLCRSIAALMPALDTLHKALLYRRRHSFVFLFITKTRQEHLSPLFS